MAFDHRSQFLDMAREAGASESRIPALKKLLVKAAEQVESSRQLQGHTGVLIDGGDYGARRPGQRHRARLVGGPTGGAAGFAPAAL
jgi:myo-inositol catabolism protein IolC